MGRALAQSARAMRHLSPDAVHDVRVALRRCRTLGDTLRELDPHPAWREMDATARRLFRRLGPLRDADVRRAWLEALTPAEDPFRRRIAARLEEENDAHRRRAAKALRQFDSAEWRSLRQTLIRRARRLSAGSPVFTLLALERWTDARALHRPALRGGPGPLHRLRIGLKRFRYTVENFLPARHMAWGRDLKRIQDLLGEAHDLDELRAELAALEKEQAKSPGGLPDAAVAPSWLARLDAEREKRVREYRTLATGEESLWQVWRAGLPAGAAAERAAFARLEAWAGFRGADRKFARHVARLAVSLFRAFCRTGSGAPAKKDFSLRVLRAAALLHRVGRAGGKKGHHKAAYRMILGLPPPLGWTSEEMKLTALVARYHRGKLPRPHHLGFAELDEAQRAQVSSLAGVLRLAEALARESPPRHARARVEMSGDVLVVWLAGYRETPTGAARIARRKILLEGLMARPIVIRCQDAQPHSPVPAASSASAEEKPALPERPAT